MFSHLHLSPGIWPGGELWFVSAGKCRFLNNWLPWSLSMFLLVSSTLLLLLLLSVTSRAWSLGLSLFLIFLEPRLSRSFLSSSQRPTPESEQINSSHISTETLVKRLRVSFFRWFICWGKFHMSLFCIQFKNFTDQLWTQKYSLTCCLKHVISCNFHVTLQLQPLLCTFWLKLSAAKIYGWPLKMTKSWLWQWPACVHLQGR